MYSQSPRMGIPLRSQTPAYVGPTTYILCNDREKLVNRVPFLSSEEKKPSFINKSFCDNFYTLSNSNKIKGGISPRNKAQRFAYNREVSPGPADYDAEEIHCTKSSSRPAARGKLYVCRVPLTLRGSGPSIPTAINENGYFLDEDGNTYRIPPDDHDLTLGPAYYKIMEPFNADRYRGCKWSKKTAKRASNATDNNPGPGEYDIENTEFPCDIITEKYREMAVRYAYVPRYLDAQERKCKKEDLPGPANYNIVNQCLCRRCDGVVPKPFISASKRFVDTIQENPSPDTYTMMRVKYPVSKKATPFLVTSSRFPQKKTMETPGPCEYETEVQEFKYVQFQPPFNKTSIRNTTEINKDAAFTPSPADYTLGDGKRCKILPSSVFKSKVKRFPKKCKQLKEVSPAHYNVTEAFSLNKNPKSHNIYDIPFNTFDRKRGVLESLNYGNPGPASYLSQGNLSSKGQLIPVTERFPSDKSDIPGPGSYSIRSLYGTSMNKAFKTHNLRLRENVLGKKLINHPRVTWEKWATCIKRSKKLKWFVNSGRDFIHC